MFWKKKKPKDRMTKKVKEMFKIINDAGEIDSGLAMSLHITALGELLSAIPKDARKNIVEIIMTVLEHKGDAKMMKKQIEKIAQDKDLRYIG